MFAESWHGGKWPQPGCGFSGNVGAGAEVDHLTYNSAFAEFPASTAVICSVGLSCYVFIFFQTPFRA